MDHKLRSLLYTLISALAYLLLDVVVQLSQFLRFSPVVGLKNALPLICGLMLGPAGALGCALAVVAGNLLMPGQPGQLPAEIFSVLLVSLGTWLSWHLLSDQGGFSLKHRPDYLRYLGLVLVWSAAAGGIGALLLGPEYFGQLMGGYASMGILVGIPVLILATSIIGFLPVLPPWRRREPDFQYTLKNGADLLSFNEQLEELAMTQGISMRRVFSIESCVEELFLRMPVHEPEAQLDIQLYLNDTDSIFVACPASKRNPLKALKGEDELDMLGLTLIRHQALRASYHYIRGVNLLHIVI